MRNNVLHPRFCVAVVVALACTAAAAAEKSAMSVTCHRSCRIEIAVTDNNLKVGNDPIIIARGRSKVHVNWHAPRGWEFMDGGVALKQSVSGAPEFEQWCASDVDDDNCANKKASGRRYHCLALNNRAGTFAYRIRLRKIGTDEVREIDPTIMNQGR